MPSLTPPARPASSPATGPAVPQTPPPAHPRHPPAPPVSRATPGEALASLTPASFGIVMATGIVSLASARLGLTGAGRSLFVLNVGLYLLVWSLVLLRFLRHRPRLLADLADHARGPGFFTAVAGTGVLGIQFIELAGRNDLGWALWWFALALWLALTYGIFAALTVKADKPPLDRGINGVWLLAVVATQAIAVLGTLLAGSAPPPWRSALGFFCLSMWLWGGMLYIWLMSLIFYRCLFLRLAPADLAPPYWINMGAMAISTLAGARLVLVAQDMPFLAQLLPFLKGFAVFYWAAGTWWIPLLLVLGVWRHLLRRFPLRYDPGYWGAVFPLGMYAAATHELSQALGLAFLDWVPPLFVAAALAAWSLALLGLLVTLAKILGPR